MRIRGEQLCVREGKSHVDAQTGYISDVKSGRTHFDCLSCVFLELRMTKLQKLRDVINQHGRVGVVQILAKLIQLGLQIDFSLHWDRPQKH